MKSRLGGEFLKLWVGQGVSQFGTQVSMLAIPTLAILVYQATPFQVSVIGAAQVVPFALFALPAGTLVDRWPRRLTLIVCDIGRALAAGALVLAYLAGYRELWVIYVVAAVMGTFTVVFDIAYLSLVPQVVGAKGLLGANARLSATDSVAETAGPAIGGALVAAIGPAKAVFVDSVSYLLSVVALLFMKTEETAREKPKLDARTMVAEIREGLRFVVRHPVLARLAVANSTFDFGVAIFQSVYLVFLYKTLHFSPWLVGVLAAVTGISNVLGAMTISRVVGRFGLGPTLVCSILAGGVAYLFLPLSQLGAAVAVIVVVNVVAGFTNAWYDINQYTLRQTVTPDHLLGRVNATMRMIFSGPRPLGFLLGGGLAVWTSVPTTIFLGALVSTVSALFVFFGPIRAVREATEDETQEAATT
ncbi:MFS transporter [Streptomyces sp. NPDC004111]|uniref:MFS transporter n=1 Tax=Streptomyces sp. NPDC004111 TaxID=3364690 RepID=UPI00369DB36C